MVTGMWLLILSHLINIGYWFLSGAVVSGVIAFAQYAIGAFVQTWVFWFAFVKREPSCCYLCVLCIEDFKPMHLIAGILVLLSGVSQALNALQALPNRRSIAAKSRRSFPHRDFANPEAETCWLS